jgi:C1A family cysteine protease
MSKPKEPSKKAVTERLVYLATLYCDLAICRSCRLPYSRGLVCICGWDNTYKPNEYRRNKDGHYERIQTL